MGDVVLCSIGTGPQEKLLRLARRSLEPFAERHGYALDLRTEPLDTERPAPWSKVALVRELLASHELVVWLDADLVVVDPSRDITDELPASSFMGLVEHRVRGRRNPNTGVVVFRAGERTTAFLDAVWNAEEFIHHRWWEQAAVMHLLGYDDNDEPTRPSEWREGVHWLPKRWNSIRDDPAPDPYIEHFPGFTVPRRYAAMAWALARSRLRR